MLDFKYDVSVVLPVFNVHQYLAVCLESLLMQTFGGSTQIILVDDSSSDGSLELCREYASNYDFITLIEHEQNKGSSVARNTGLGAVAGRYYMFVDPDDILLQDTVEKLYLCISVSGADVVKGSNTSFSELSNSKLASYSVTKKEMYTGDDCLAVLLEHSKLRGHPWGKIYRSDYFLHLRFTQGFKMTQDLLYNAQLFSKARLLIIIPDIVYQYRIHDNGATGKKYQTNAYKDWLRCVSEIEKFVKTPKQQRSYTSLKIRTLNQITKEMRLLTKDELFLVVPHVRKYLEMWSVHFGQLLIVSGLSPKIILRYFKYKSTWNTIIKKYSNF